MLSEDTKLVRINEKLSKYNIRMSWASYNLRNYEPCLYKINSDNLGIYSIYEGIKFHITVRVENNRVIFFIDNLCDNIFQTPFSLKTFILILREISNDLDYCSRLGLIVPEYK